MTATGSPPALPAGLDDLGLLSTQAGRLEPPIRSVLFGLARFEQHGRSLARTHEVVRGSAAGAGFFPRLEDNIAVLRRARALLERHAREGHHLGPAALWLLDNAALIDEQLHAIRRGLPRNFFRLLPRLRDEPLPGLPRVYGVAWAWVAHTDAGFDAELLEAYLRAYQSERALTLAELWALPTTLRVVLVENLRRLAERSATLQAARDAAHQWVDQPDTARNTLQLERLERLASARGVADAFLLTIEQRRDELPPSQCRELTAWLALRLHDPAGALSRQQSEATEDQQSIRNAITTLRHVDRLDWRGLFARTSTVMQILQSAPVHAAEREDTQDETLHAVERLARESGLSETAVAKTLLELTQRTKDAADPGAAPMHWWGGAGEHDLRAGLGLKPRWWPRRGSRAFRRLATAVYLPGLALLAIAITAGLLVQLAPPAASGWLLLATALLLLGPIGEAVVALTNRLISESVQPQKLPRLAFAGGIPAEERVLVVIPSLLSSERAAAALVAQLEQHYLANPEAEAQFALLTDWADADEASLPTDASQLEAAQRAIEALNRRHPAPDGAPLRFLLLHRTRQWSECEQRCIGWERKRGKLEQLVRALAEPDFRPFVPLGALSLPAAGVQHVVTLDSDTVLPPGRLRALVGVAAHPLNRPRIDMRTRRVVAGYGILQPHVVTPLPAPGFVTAYHTIFSGQCGIDPYSAASSEVYQDVFGEGSFTGKGLLNVQALRWTLLGRLPENQVLSHDLLEGCIARCAGLSDVTVVEDAPVHADAAAARLHRWTRGDWQLLPFLRSAGEIDMPLISRWKMIDNLRRSLVVPQSLALVLLVLASGVLPLGWTLGIVAAAFGAGPLLGALAGLAPSRDDIALKLFYYRAGADVVRVAGIVGWHLAQLLQLGMMYADAIGRALWRQWVSRRHLLQWTTAADAQAAARTRLDPLLQAHAREPLAAALLLLGLALLHLAGAPVQWPAACALLGLWAASPLWTWLASRPRPPHEALQPEERQYLQGLARDSWRFYERHVGVEDNHLPPDNVQMVPTQMVAHRTSPTNIGLYLLATACVRTLGFIGTVEMAERIDATLNTLERLPRHRGHFYNWIDSRTLAVLPPAYVSAVDSGNCSAHLLAVARACEEAAAAPDNSAALRTALRGSAQRATALQPVLAGSPMLRAVAALGADARDWPIDEASAQAVQAQVRQARAELDQLRLGDADGAVNDSMWRLHDHVASLESALRDLLVADSAALRAQLLALAERARTLALAPDYAMLFDPQRKLLHIGYRADAGQLDDNHYDLLASEARLTSLVAIAKGDVPSAHWSALGRPFFAHGTEVGLKSWSGSMFEYLMPSLVLDEPVGSVLHQVTRSAVAEQMAEARERGTPWGISESAIAGQDHTLAFQYGPQGVPRLALRRTPHDERVIAPYATALALLVAPQAAIANLQALQQLGARRAFGFLEALDYTPQRQAAGSTMVEVDAYMAHHQAMGLIAIADVLTRGIARRWAMSDPHLRAVAPLLHERAPREVAVLADPAPVPPPRRPRSAHLMQDSKPLDDALPATQLLTNGRHAVALRSHGGGWSSWQGVGLTRWRDDLLRPAHGSFFFVQRRSKPLHSLTAHPAPDRDARYHCRMQPDRVVFDTQWPDLHSRCTVWVSPEDDCEMRQVELTNAGSQPITLTLAWAAEPTLAPQRGDEAHPAFSNLFLQARWDAAEHALYLRRRPRLHDEPVVQAVFFLALAEGAVEGVEAAADRGPWLGRYGQAAAPRGTFPGRVLAEADAPPVATATAPAGDDAAADAAADANLPLPGVPLDTGLDPLAMISVRLKLNPGATTRLTFCAAASHDLDQLGALVDKYRQASHLQRASSMSHTMAGIRLRELGFDADTWIAVLRLNTLLTAHGTRDLPAAHRIATAAAPRCDRRLLWRLGISGDRPILLVTIIGEPGLGMVQSLKKALRLWTAAGLGLDLVVINAEPPSYLSPVQQQLQVLRERHLALQDEHIPADRRATLHVLKDQELSADERHTLLTLARLRLQADGRTLAQQLDRVQDDYRRDRLQRSTIPRWPVQPLLPAPSAADAPPPPVSAAAASGLAAPAGHLPEGRFDAEHGDFTFGVEAARHPARPWVNVLANAQFGCQVTEAGGGYTWAGNSRMHQLTGWANDPLTDPAAEWLLLHDLDRGQVWPLGRALAAGGGARQVTHGIGFTRMQQSIDGLEITLTWCVDVAQAVKQVQVQVRASAGKPRRLRLVALLEWQMGSARAERLSVVTRSDALQLGPQGAGLPEPEPMTALQATQLDHLGGFGNATAFVAWRPTQPDDADHEHSADGPTVRPLAEDWTCDRREFFDPAGRMMLPARLGRRGGTGLDPCAALSCLLTPPSGGEARLTLLIGHAAHPMAAHALLEEACAVDPAERLARQRAQWPALLGGIRVRTPDHRFDALVNHWLGYQTLGCRMWARAGYYQASGAFGFRDQLQDAMALVTRAPALLAQQIRACAARQFAAGDVQHWWHEPGGAGVRTHFSDDRLWLPLAIALYVERSGDATLLDVRAPFLVGGQVPEGAEDLYETPQVSADTASLYEHGARAIDRSLQSGAHGLPLFGTGDWNDGMNRVGDQGRGESVWMGWFLCMVIEAFTPLAAERGDETRVASWRSAREGWQRALDDAGWDGQWYRRGFFDDGSPLGSAANSECRIDLIAQAWAVLSGAGDPQRAQQAMASAQALLFDEHAGLARLLDPPLQRAAPPAGYIQSYPPGVRENGGQYNHGAVWALMALARLGQAEAAWQVFAGLSPAHRSADPGRAAAYAIEPYVMAGDVYSQPPYRGRGGWSWYTGSAGWLLRAAVESICGVVPANGRVRFAPCLPPHWPEASVALRDEAGRWHRFIVCNGEAACSAALAREPQARRIALDEVIELATLPAASVHVLLAPPTVGPGLQQETAVAATAR
ncbi:carbohydrate-binding protein [Aquincola sp. S2]|uniref:Carbohydrate-binding protein n=1 Tax=Pseudaquabacterium terrae TaxID=2732868 RepID=A0ABX2EHM8_9BURK|nr:glucoamylase family protein [Aquabacterium terrae]NRF68136.1 carbohydrate-binding protein [Aquabacterium terrae]